MWLKNHDSRVVNRIGQLFIFVDNSLTKIAALFVFSSLLNIPPPGQAGGDGEGGLLVQGGADLRGGDWGEQGQGQVGGGGTK